MLCADIGYSETCKPLTRQLMTTYDLVTHVAVSPQAIKVLTKRIDRYSGPNSAHTAPGVTQNV